MPFIAGAQTAVPVATPAPTATAPAPVAPATLGNPGLTPGDFLYFLDQWGEGLRTFFTLSAEGKARLALEHAQERAAEVQEVVKTRGIDSAEAKEARDGFGKKIAQAASIVAAEKSKGRNVEALAKDIDDELESSKEALKGIYRDYSDTLKSMEKDLRDKIQNAIRSGDATTQSALEAELAKITDDALMALDEEGALDDDFDDEKGLLEEAMGQERSAQAHLENIDRKYEKALRDAREKGETLDSDLLNQYDDLNAQADEAFKVGDFEAAKEYAKEADNVLRDAEQGVTTKDLESSFFGEDDGMNGENGRDDSVGVPEMEANGRR